MKRRTNVVVGWVLAASACSSFSTGGDKANGVTAIDAGPDADAGSGADDAAVTDGARDATADAGDLLSGPCSELQKQADTYCVDFDRSPIGPAPAPTTLNSFAGGSHDPSDRAAWDVVASGESLPNAGRVRVTPLDGGFDFSPGAALEIALPENPSVIDCALSWTVVVRGKSESADFPENFALLTLFYTDMGANAFRLSLVTNVAGSAQFYQPNLAPTEALTDLPGFEGLGWRRARVRFAIPAAGHSSFVEVSQGNSKVNVPFTQQAMTGGFHVFLGPDAVSTTPWEVLFDDVVCHVTH